MLSEVRSRPVEPPVLPEPRGPLSSEVIARLRGEPAPTADPAAADPYGEDLQLALYCGYESHYRGFAGVDDDHEWDPALLGVRRGLERVFLDALRAEVEPGTNVDAEIDALLVEPAEADGVGGTDRGSPTSGSV